MSFDERVKKLNEVQRGWVNNFRIASIQAKLKDVDSWIRNRLRYCIWHHWKKSENKPQSLIRLGVEPDQAICYSSNSNFSINFSSVNLFFNLKALF